MLGENAELTSRLIDVALTSSHNDVFDAAFGGEGTSQAGALAQLPLGHWSQEEVQRRHKEATEEVLLTACSPFWNVSRNMRFIFWGHTFSTPLPLCALIQ